MTERRNWSEEETLAAFALYFLVSPSKVKKDNKDVIALASALGRTPDAVRFKLANIMANDPMRETKGFENGSKLDVQVWVDFKNQGEDQVARAVKQLGSYLKNHDDLSEATRTAIGGLLLGMDSPVATTRRVNQCYFRNSLLENYNHQCCFTGLGKGSEQLLIASHIKPWAASDQFEKVAPDNGLLLNALHDRAFDQGLMTIKPDLTIVVSSKVPKDGPNASFIWDYDGRQLRPPKRSRPRKEFIEYHNDMVFQR